MKQGMTGKVANGFDDRRCLLRGKLLFSIQQIQHNNKL